MKNSQKGEVKIPLKKALVWVLLSVLLIVGSATLGLLYYHYVRELYANDDTYRVVALVQTTPNQENLKTVYLAELLDLSIDCPTNLYRLSCKEARRKLLSFPLIKEATVKKVKPGTVYIDYTMRKPIAYLTDLSNTAIDAEGVPFPFKPFFTPKRLPEIYLGVSAQIEEEGLTDEGKWGVHLQSKEAALSLLLLEEIEKYYSKEISNLQKIDVSKAYASSCGQRQIIILLEEKIEQKVNGKNGIVIFPRLLRLNSDCYRQGLANYKALLPELNKQPLKLSDKSSEISSSKLRHPLTIIDLRLSNLGFISRS